MHFLGFEIKPTSGYLQAFNIERSKNILDKWTMDDRKKGLQ